MAQCWQSAAKSESNECWSEYCGFQAVFGEGHSADASQAATGPGSRWITTEIAVKPYAALAFVHAGIDAALALRAKKQIVPHQVLSILIEVGNAAFAHGGFPIHWPIEPITAQMSLRYSVAIALLDGAALHQAVCARPDRGRRRVELTTHAVSSWESEELDERPHALLLAAARKSLGSCQLGDTMEARPKQFR